jgi:hypothetical protein
VVKVLKALSFDVKDLKKERRLEASSDELKPSKLHVAITLHALESLLTFPHVPRRIVVLAGDDQVSQGPLEITPSTFITDVNPNR